jgi:hypothetical protein
MLSKSNQSSLILFFYVNQNVDFGSNTIIGISDNRRFYCKDIQYGLDTYFIPMKFPERVVKYNLILTNTSLGDGSVDFILTFYELTAPSGYFDYPIFVNLNLNLNETKQVSGEFPFYFKLNEQFSGEPDRYYFFKLDATLSTINIKGVIAVERI